MSSLPKKSSRLRLGGIFILSTMLICVPSHTFASDMYKWTDYEGRVHYSDKFPGEEAKDISRKRIPTTPARTAEPVQSESENPLAKYLEESRDSRQRALEEKRRLAREKRDAEGKLQSREKCDKARAVVQLLEENINGIVRRRSEDRPEVVSASPLSRSEIQDELDKWRREVKSSCGDDDSFGIRNYAPKELPFSIPYYP